MRYADSDLYAKLRERSPIASGSSEIQSATVNVGLLPQSSKGHSKSDNRTTDCNRKLNAVQQSSKRNDGDAMDYSEPHFSAKNGATMHDGSCQVCLIKGLKDDLITITKVIQERNEQLTSKLKARRMRSFFERQMLD